MRLGWRIAISLVIVAGCSRGRGRGRGNAETVATVDEPWSHAYSGASDGWWKDWDTLLGGKAPFGVGTELELETIGAQGSSSQVLVVRSIRPTVVGGFEVELASSDGLVMRASLPPRLAFTAGATGALTTRNEKLLSVTVPAGSFAAGRLWKGEHHGSLVYERDEWVVPDLPVPVQSWSRPVNAAELYNPPADGTIPEGTSLTRLVRIEKR